MGDVAGVLFTHGASASKKWLDAPESSIAHCSRFFSVIEIFGSMLDAAYVHIPWLFAASGCCDRGVGVETKVVIL